MKIKIRQNIGEIIIYFLLIFGVIITIFPIVWIFSGAFKAPSEIFAYPPAFISKDITINNFIVLFRDYNFLRYIANSFIVAISVSLIAIFVHAMAAYSLARLNIPARNLIFIIFISTMFIPSYGVVIPRYLVTESLNWVDTYWGLIIPSVPHAFGIFALRQFFLTIPRELEEAAMIDGASKIRIFFTIILPLSKGILITLIILFFVYTWDDFYWPLVVTNSESMRVTQVALAHFRSRFLTRWELIMAGSVISLIPTFIIFFVFQRYLVKGVKTSGLKY